MREFSAMATNYLVGSLAAALAPLAMSFGFILWGKSWKSTAYALNLFKCTFAAMIFMFISFGIRQNIPKITVYDESMIVLSSILGIVIGDNTWLLALQMIGAKRVIIIDTFKPLLAALLGTWILHEPLTWNMMVGITISTIGIIAVSTEKSSESSENNEKDEKQENEQQESFRFYFIGYVLAFINVFLDAIGSVLTKQFGFHLNTWEINFLRFGFASISMAFIAVAYYFFQKFLVLSSTSSLSSDSEYKTLRLDDTERAVPSKETTKADVSQQKWFLFPHHSVMTTEEWSHVIVGILFVTFLCPALSNYALFQIPLGLCLTLTSLGPVYAIPLVFLMSGERTGWQGMVGGLLAVAGVAIMYL